MRPPATGGPVATSILHDERRLPDSTPAARISHRSSAVPREGRLLVLTAPGGFDGFFRELAAAHDAGRAALTHTPQRQSVTASRGCEPRWGLGEPSGPGWIEPSTR